MQPQKNLSERKQNIIPQKVSPTKTPSSEKHSSQSTQHHEMFGNTIVLEAIQGGSDLLQSSILSSLTLEMAQIQSHAMGENHQIQQVLHRRQVQGGSKDEELPDISDPRVQRITQSGGSPLPAPLKERLEQEFSHSFDHVRIHASGGDAESAEALNAHAFTVGSHIFFGQGKFSPQTINGMELLAHELTHVVQSDEGRLSGSSGGMEVSSPTDAVEIEAERIAAEEAKQK